MTSTRLVLHVCPYLHPLAGGPVAVVLQYADRLRGLGYTPTILTTDWYSPGGKEEILQRYAGKYHFDVLCTGKSFIKSCFKENREIIRETVNNATLLHIHGLWHAVGMLSMRYARHLGVPYVISPHGMLDPYSMSVGIVKKRLYWAWLERENIRRAARVLFTTEAEQRHAYSAVGQVGRGEVVLLGADDPPAESRADLKNSALSNFPFLQDKQVVLFLGRIHEKKGVHLLVRMFSDVLRKVPNAFLLIVGDGEERYLDYIKSEIKLHSIEENVYFSGLLEGRDKWSAIAVSDVFVLPSLQENFALVVAEVMKMGVPVVISDKVNLASFVRSVSTELVLSLTHLEKWTLEIQRLLQDKEIRASLGMQCRSMAMESFSWDTSSEALGKVYGDVLLEAASGSVFS